MKENWLFFWEAIRRHWQEAAPRSVTGAVEERGWRAIDCQTHPFDWRRSAGPTRFFVVLQEASLKLFDPVRGWRNSNQVKLSSEPKT